MAAAVLTLVLTFLAAGAAWIALGPRVRLDEDDQVNGLLNLGLYYLLGLPVIFIVVFTIIG